MEKKFIPPFKTGHLTVGDGHSLYYECWGNKSGKPVLFLHGGPGTGFFEKDKRFFNPKVWNVIFFDQRGSGKSTPFGSIKNNTTQDLVEDVNRLLSFLKIEKIFLFGGSWGSSLALIYATQNLKKVTGMLLRGIWLCDKKSIEHYANGGIKDHFPEVWERFEGMVPKNRRQNLVKFYFDQMISGDPKIREKYAYEYGIYEDSIVHLNYDPQKIERTLKKAKYYHSLSPLEAHYILNNCFIPEGYILNNASQLSKLPLSIIHGRYDFVCEPISAYVLHKKIKGSKLFFTTAGHSAGDPENEEKLTSEMRRFERII